MKLKKIVSILLVAVMIFAVAGCGDTGADKSSEEAPDTTQSTEPSDEPATTDGVVADGTYEGVSEGFGGELKLNVTVAGGAISAVEVTSHGETAGVSDTAINLLPERMVEQQTVNVDALAGATFSSAAVITAAKSALSEADPTGLLSETKEIAVEPKTIDTDIVIVGSGMGGLVSAISAKEAGANVVVIEKLGRYGGSAVTSGGILFATNSPINKDIDNDPAGMVDYWMGRAENKADRNLLQVGADQSGSSVQWLIDHGVEFQDEVQTVGTYDKLLGHYTTSQGAGFIVPLVEKARELGVDILLETTAVEIIQDTDGNVAGIKAESKYGDVTVNSKAVIMATGGFDANPEFIEKYSPEAVGSLVQSSSGNTGDGIVMGEAVGAATVFQGGVIGLRCVETSSHFTAGLNTAVWIPSLVVTDEGERFADESSDYPIYYTNMLKTGREEFFVILDSSLGDLGELAVSKSQGFKGDDIAGLAAAAGIPAEALEATFARYQELGAAGVDDDFGKEGIAALAEAGPYYAVKMRKSTIGTMGGLKINETAQVLKEDGEIIPGFYAVGECANGDMFYKEYPASGTMIGLCTSFGRLAAEDAVEFVK